MRLPFLCGDTVMAYIVMALSDETPFPCGDIVMAYMVMALSDGTPFLCGDTVMAYIVMALSDGTPFSLWRRVAEEGCGGGADDRQQVPQPRAQVEGRQAQVYRMDRSRHVARRHCKHNYLFGNK